MKSDHEACCTVQPGALRQGDLIISLTLSSKLLSLPPTALLDFHISLSNVHILNSTHSMRLHFIVP